MIVVEFIGGPRSNTRLELPSRPESIGRTDDNWHGVYLWVEDKMVWHDQPRKEKQND